MIPEAQHFDALLCEKVVSLLISGPLVSKTMPAAIEFDGKLRDGAVEIEEVDAARVLTAEFEFVETRRGLLAAWFGGSRERSPDVAIWLSYHDGKKWSEPEEVANGYHEQEGIRYPCWNPVLFQPKQGPLYLFYKEGPSPANWWGLLKVSDNDGKTWSQPKRLPENIYGPIRNKPVELEDGRLLCGSSTEDAGWRVHTEWTRNPLRSWSRSPALNSAAEYGAIQPTLLMLPGGKLQMLCRSKHGKILESFSSDFGETWNRLLPTVLPNPNSAIDSVRLREGPYLLVYNHSASDRGILNIAVSLDGKKWQAAFVLENTPGDEYSYPAVIQTSDSMVHITYTWNRQKIKHVVIDPTKLVPREMIEGVWP